MAQLLLSGLMLLVGLPSGENAWVTRGATSSRATLEAPPAKPKSSPGPKPPAISCTLLTLEAPRGGRLEVQGHGFGRAPLVHIGGKVTRMIERTESRIAVQIPADSNGGAVTVTNGRLRAECGTLAIIGRD
jgi:hypothetical protein